MTVDALGLLLIATALGVVIARRLHIPAIAALLVIGIGIGALQTGAQFTMTRELVFDLLLPPLLFEAAINIRWAELKCLMWPLVLLVTLGLVLSMFTLTSGAVALGWPLIAALPFAALISSTDPVSVIAMLKERRVPARLALLLKAESLLNDGTAAVAFAVCVALPNSSPSVGSVALQLTWTLLGGAICGTLVAGIGLLVAGATEEHLVELTITTVVAFGSFLLAEHFGASGVLATLVAGLLLGKRGRPSVLTARGREAVDSFWDFAAFVSTSLIFLLMGVRVAQLHFVSGAGLLVMLALLALLARAICVYGTGLALLVSKCRLSRQEQHALVFGGTRGPLAVALALSLAPGFPYRDAILEATFVCVAFSIIVQITLLPRVLACQ